MCIRDSDYTAAYGVHNYRRDKPRVRAGQYAGQHRHAHKPRCGQHMSRYYAGAIAYPVHKARAKVVNQQLRAEVYGDKQRNLVQRQAKFALKRQKQQRREVVHYSLSYVSKVTGVQRVIVVAPYAHVYIRLSHFSTHDYSTEPMHWLDYI